MWINNLCKERDICYYQKIVTHIMNTLSDDQDNLNDDSGEFDEKDEKLEGFDIVGEGDEDLTGESDKDISGDLSFGSDDE